MIVRVDVLVLLSLLFSRGEAQTPTVTRNAAAETTTQVSFTLTAIAAGQIDLNWQCTTATGCDPAAQSALITGPPDTKNVAVTVPGKLYTFEIWTDDGAGTTDPGTLPGLTYNFCSKPAAVTGLAQDTTSYATDSVKVDWTRDATYTTDIQYDTILNLMGSSKGISKYCLLRFGLSESRRGDQSRVLTRAVLRKSDQILNGRSLSGLLTCPQGSDLTDV